MRAITPHTSSLQGLYDSAPRGRKVLFLVRALAWLKYQVRKWGMDKDDLKQMTEEEIAAIEDEVDEEDEMS